MSQSAAATPQAAVQADWQNREFVESLSKGVRRIAEFLNEFEMSTRFKLSKLNEKLTALERSIAYVEAKVERAEASAAS
eukprot:m.353510 g.353510  ORF g.353510 m.353510 type:complete len:79 (-) comp16781_c0_seq1:2070-2306(-)